MDLDWDIVKAAFNDELEKIAAIDIRGLSTDTVLNGAKQPDPFETAGLDKARQILAKLPQAEAEMAEQMPKTAGAAEKYEYGRDLALKMIAGAGAGGGIAGITANKDAPSNKRKAVGAALGASLFGLDHVISKRIAKKREEATKAKAVGIPPQDPSSKIASLSPAAQLSRSTQVAVPTGKRLDGVSAIKKFTPKI